MIASAVSAQTTGDRLGAEAPAYELPGAVVLGWNPVTPKIGYGFAALVDRTSSGGAPNDSVITVGAQINASNGAGVHQIVFGIATEAWAHPGSVSRLVGIEATTINREPSNGMRKIAIWATFKNRYDFQYGQPPADAMNVDSQALRIESEPGTGFERGITFAHDSLRPSKAEPTPVAIDYREVPLAVLKTWALERYPDGFCRFYAGAGAFETRAC